MKKVLSFLLIAQLIMSVTLSDTSFASVTTANHPKEYAGAKWEIKLGEGFTAAPTPPLLYNRVLYVGSGNRVFKIDRETGAIIGKSPELAGKVGFAMMPPVYGDGKIFIAVGNGTVQALDPNTLAIKWKSDPRTGATNSPLIYDEGSRCIYTGTWSNKDGGGEYFCLDSATGKLKWYLSHSDGFYWSGAYVNENSIVFGSESIYRTDDSTIYSVDKSSGEIVSTMGAIGNIRSTAVGIPESDGTDSIFITTQNSKLYKLTVNDESKIEESDVVNISGGSTGEPTIYNNKILFGTSNRKIDIFDMDDLEKAGSISVPGFVQAEMLLRENEDDTFSIFSSYNLYPGGIFRLTVNQNNLDSFVLDNKFFVPVNTQFCTCPLICDEEGTIYYKNDSCYLMAVSIPEKITGVTPKVQTNSYNSHKISWQKMSGAVGYDIYRSTSRDKGFVKTKTLSSATVAAADGYVDTGLDTGRNYYYKLQAKYPTSDGNTKFSKMSAVSYAKPELNKPSIKTKKTKKGISVNWKRVDGASGYVIYKATSKNGKYKKVKTIKKSSTKTWTDKKVKSKKKYHYKVKAYRNVSGKKVYSVYSNISNKKAK